MTKPGSLRPRPLTLRLLTALARAHKNLTRTVFYYNVVSNR
ncbi:Hypothetical protein LOCK908_0110 [Lacticaseibacillus rhamnosus LOCK908]|uniref:Uncharacterized protein n=1 Tax=Lacticaseibacillus rhamnosus (strain LMS2-1) TaxID=525361 RepID=C2JTL5_LACRM|nr:hypothetical protein LRHK_111 [Lacticaseibacillus rhamnosus ATCC 8530]AGP72797.1 Hypothetical protein LOCK908_0110 [Lacticaseibacillus rhamnosus LOCK908]EEN81561.1 hypothetical protein HMPREF0539_0249 [Lacticaseibacillus rhamnosus LMS2-1]